jgi:hypothetical protein
MTCNGHPSAECFGKCSNWYIENGVHGCKASTPASFRAQATTSIGDPQQRLQQQFDEIFKVIDKLRRTQVNHRKLAIAALKSRLNLLIAKVHVLLLREQERATMAARRRQLTLKHPWGFMSDLGYSFSMSALEAMNRTQEPSEFESYEDLLAHLDSKHFDSLLANPAKIAALRAAACE